MKTLYGMADEMDTKDFFIQNIDNVDIIFAKEDVSTTINN